MSAGLAVTTSEFQEKVIQSEVPVLVDFWAPWCQPCLRIGPFIEEIAKEYDGKAKVFKVNVDENQEIAQDYNVSGIPAVLVFKGGREVDRVVGAGPKKIYSQLLDRSL